MVTARLAVLPFLALIAITIISLLPGRKEISSVFLTAETTEDNTTIRTDYLDEDGQLTFASNLRYASIVRTREDGKVILEEYYDENWSVKRDFYFDADGNPAASDLGQYGYYREYDGSWNETLTEYLDADGNIMNTDKGYGNVRGDRYCLQQCRRADRVCIDDGE